MTTQTTETELQLIRAQLVADLMRKAVDRSSMLTDDMLRACVKLYDELSPPPVKLP